MPLNRHSFLPLCFLLVASAFLGCRTTAAPRSRACSPAVSAQEAMGQLARSATFAPLNEFEVLATTLDGGECSTPWAHLKVTLATPTFLSPTHTSYETVLLFNVSREDGAPHFTEANRATLGLQMLHLLETIPEAESVPMVRRFREQHPSITARAVGYSRPGPLCLEWTSLTAESAPSIRWCPPRDSRISL